jgi:hypothetical protein
MMFEPTPELRWFQHTYTIAPTLVGGRLVDVVGQGPRVLQQRWVCRLTELEEWRDVPEVQGAPLPWP